MNRKLMYLFAVLVLGLFVIGACQQEVGGRINNKKNIIAGEDPLVICDCGTLTEGGNDHYYCTGTLSNGVAHCGCCDTSAIYTAD